MDSKVALDKIKEAEIKAQHIVEQAKLEARNMLQEGKLEKDRIIKIAIEKAKTDSQKVKNRITAETLRETSSIENKTKDEVGALKEKVMASFDKALDFIRSKLD